MSRLWASPELATLIKLALEEDGVHDDVTSRALVPESAVGTGRVVARAEGVIAGIPLLAAEGPLLRAFPSVAATVRVADGARLARGDVVADLTGPARALLGLERTLLNFLQRLSGIATMTDAFVAATDGRGTRIQETRKTCPGWRLLDKYAVAVGGGLNHREGLHDQVLIKENHLAFVPGGTSPDGVVEAVERSRQHAPASVAIEIEVEDLPQLRAALGTAAQIIMLDDFDDEAVSAAVALRNEQASTALLEVSGSVSLERVGRLARLGVDRISVGALTHSVRALDLAVELDLQAAS